MSIIANGGGIPRSQTQLDAEYEARRAEYEKRRAYIAAMRERGYHFHFGSNAPNIVWCLSCGLMVGDVDLHDASPCRALTGGSTETADREPHSTAQAPEEGHRG